MSLPQLTAEDEALVRTVQNAYDAMKDVHQAARNKWERFYAQYRSYRDFKRSYSDAAPKDVDSIMGDGRRAFDPDLFIPYTFSVIESMLPRLVATNPRLLITPASPEWEPNVANVKLMVDRQQTKGRYPLAMQDIGKSGLLYGLGVGKVTWEERWQRGAKFLEKPSVETSGGPEWVIGKKDKLRYEGALTECVDIFDFLWDPYAHDAASLRRAIHRLWLPPVEVRQRVEDGVWTLPAGVTLEDVLGLGSEEARDSIWNERMQAGGYANPNKRGGHMHEVWEFHDGSQVITVLDRECPVQHGGNPFWHGELPFQVYRPTRVLHELPGIGEAEAIEDLQDEMNTMRSQRRANANLVLQRPFAYFDGLVNPSDLEFGPGLAIPVDGDPRELLYPIPMEDIPASSYREEERLQMDIERVTGIDDTVAGAEGGGGASNTATGVQLVQAAANVRIANKTLRLDVEVVKPQAEQYLALNQQKILTTKKYAGPPKPGDNLPPHVSWSWYQIGPAELAGEYEIEPEGGSMAPENVIQKHNDAVAQMNLFRGDPLVNQRLLYRDTLENLGKRNAESWLVPEQPNVPVAVLDAIKKAGGPQVAGLVDTIVTRMAEQHQEVAAGDGG